MQDDSSGSPERIQQAFVNALVDIATSPPDSADRLLRACLQTLDVESGRLLTLAPESGELELAAEVNGHGIHELLSYERCGMLDYLEKPEIESVAGGRVVRRVRAHRADSIVGAIELVVEADSELDEEGCGAFAQLVPLVRANMALRSGLRVLPPIPDAYGDASDFGERVHDYLDAHTRAKLIAVFVVGEDLDVSLICGPRDIATRSWLGTDEVAEMIRESALLEPGVVHSSTVDSMPGLAEYGLDTILRLSTADPAEAPVASQSQTGRGQDAYVLLAGFPIRYCPSSAELAVLEHSLELAGYLDQVYRHVHEIAGSISQVAEIGSAITGLETSQMARHHAKTEIDYAQHVVLEVRQRRVDVDEGLERLDVTLLKIASDLDAIRDEMKAPDRTAESVALRAMWDSARGLLQWRLNRRNISIRYDGPSVDVVAAPDWFRQVFLNLLINSADAYDKVEKRKGKVTLRVHDPGSSSSVSMSYSDDAIGILPQHFLHCDVAADVELPQRIFKPGVTSKHGGSGWGLYVCRSIVDNTPGASIDFVPTRGGVRFDVTMQRAGGKE